MKNRMLTVSMAPHTSDPGSSTSKIMGDVLIALIPALLTAMYFFGWNAFRVIAVSCLSCVLFEHIIQSYIFKKKTTIGDLSAVLTGLLLAFNLPAGIPTWMIIIGACFAIGVAKMCYGGLGNNIFNPALVGRVFLMLSFPVAMTTWPKPFAVDGISGATPLSILKESLKNSETMPAVMAKMPSFMSLFLGNRGGCLGEISVLALLSGFAYLLYRKVITWHIPVIILAVIAGLTGIISFLSPQMTPLPLFHILTGGVILGAVYMATDYSSSPMTLKGSIFYAVGIGIFTVVIRVWGSYPEGISFAILIMNAFVPLINKYNKPYRFGEHN